MAIEQEVSITYNGDTHACTTYTNSDMHVTSRSLLMHGIFY